MRKQMFLLFRDGGVLACNKNITSQLRNSSRFARDSPRFPRYETDESPSKKELFVGANVYFPACGCSNSFTQSVQKILLLLLW